VSRSADATPSVRRRQGALRPTALLAGFLLVTAAVLGLASWGGWAGITGVLLVLGVVLAALIRLGDGGAAQHDADQ
jgi:hypothetical protein